MSKLLQNNFIDTKEDKLNKIINKIILNKSSFINKPKL